MGEVLLSLRRKGGGGGLTKKNVFIYRIYPCISPGPVQGHKNFWWAYIHRGAYTQGGPIHITKKWYPSEKHVSTQWVISIQNHRFSAFFASFHEKQLKQLNIT